MLHGFTEEEVFIESVHKLKGSDKRVVLAKTCNELGVGGQTIVAKEFNVSRNTIRKGFSSTVFSDLVYKSGKKVSKEIMKIYENMVDSADDIGKWNDN